LNQAIRNAGDGISFLQIADGALGEITNMLTRMVTLAEEAANEPIDERGRQALDAEFQELQAEIARLAKQTNFNGTKIFAQSPTVPQNEQVIGELKELKLLQDSYMEAVKRGAGTSSLGIIQSDINSKISVIKATVASALNAITGSLSALSNLGLVGAPGLTSVQANRRAELLSIEVNLRALYDDPNTKDSGTGTNGTGGGALPRLDSTDGNYGGSPMGASEITSINKFIKENSSRNSRPNRLH